MKFSSAANRNAEFRETRTEAALERAHDRDRRGDPGGMPVHAHHAAEGLKPKGVTRAAQKFGLMQRHKCLAVAYGLRERGKNRHGPKLMLRSAAPDFWSTLRYALLVLDDKTFGKGFDCFTNESRLNRIDRAALLYLEK
jgi:hypothetical protein